ncbi:MAG: hypothetical protein MZV63_19425 [Marinilabiliales bacterium]|nr:hypothetical protein [Marinilabiliales bacterium]
MARRSGRRPCRWPPRCGSAWPSCSGRPAARRTKRRTSRIALAACGASFVAALVPGGRPVRRTVTRAGGARPLADQRRLPGGSGFRHRRFEPDAGDSGIPALPVRRPLCRELHAPGSGFPPAVHGVESVRGGDAAAGDGRQRGIDLRRLGSRRALLLSARFVLPGPADRDG